MIRQEFVMNIPTMEILNATESCGTVSGKDHDKFKENGLTRLRAEKVKAPPIKECVASLECKVHSQFPTGDHTIFVGEIVGAHSDKGMFTTTYNSKRTKMVFYVGGNKFATLAPKVFKPKPKSLRV